MTRRERLLKIADSLGIDPAVNAYSGEEDLAEILEDDEWEGWDLCYAAITYSGEYPYLKVYENFQAAARAATENMDDSIFAEAPGKIIDLDDGRRWRPRVEWDIVEGSAE